MWLNHLSEPPFSTAYVVIAILQYKLRRPFQHELKWCRQYDNVLRVLLEVVVGQQLVRNWSSKIVMVIATCAANLWHACRTPLTCSASNEQIFTRQKKALVRCYIKA